MFNLAKTITVDNSILKCDVIRYTSLLSINLVSRENNQFFIGITREDSAVSLQDSYAELLFL